MPERPKRSLKWFLLLPVALAGSAVRWLRRSVTSPKSPEEVRADDKARQSAVRRGLRGLPAEHDQQSRGQ